MWGYRDGRVTARYGLHFSRIVYARGDLRVSSLSRRRRTCSFKGDDNGAGCWVVDDELDFGSAVVEMLEGEA